MRRFCSTLLPFLVIGLVLLAGCDSGSTVPSDLGSNTSVGFTETANAVSEESGEYTLEIVANDPGYKELPLSLTFDESQSTVTLGDDVVGLPADTTITFPQSTTAGGTLPISFEIIDEPVDSTGFLEDTETLTLSLAAADTSGLSVSEDASTFTLTIEEDDDPLTMEEARERDTGARAVVDGIVTRVDADGAYVQDDSGGLYVFDGDYAGQVSPGDEVLVDGTTAYFSGLFQLQGASSGALTEVLSSGNALPDPQVISVGEVSSNGEEYESEVVRVENFSIDDGGDDSFQGGTNYTISNGSGSATLRIPGESALVGESIPDRANFQGVLGQFNNFGDPGDDTGYQLLALETGDLEGSESLLAVNFSDEELAPMTAVNVSNGNSWGIGTFDGNAYAVANGFGGSEPANTWLVTPALNLNSFDGETLSFRNAKNFDDEGLDRGLQVKVSTDYDGSGNPENFTWTNISDRVENYSGGGYTYVSSGAIDLTDSQFQSDEVYVAFQYRSSGTGGGSTEEWQVDDIVVTGVPAN